MKKSHWYNYLWIWSVIYFAMGFFHILFAWLGLISFFLPLIFAVGVGSKGFCNRYCDRGQLLRALGGQKGFSRRKDVPDWMKSKAFRYGFLAFFMAMFANMLCMTYQVYAGGAEPWAAQFAFGFYSMMLTSAILGVLTMLAYKPRSWCVYCPMGTMTQMICRMKAGAKKESNP